MIYLLAAIGLATLLYLFWRAFGPSMSNSEPGPNRRNTTMRGPDDDPEFLWKLGHPKD